MIDQKIDNSRRGLLRWVGWFFALNIIPLGLICLSYINVLPNFSSTAFVSTKGVILAWVFTVFAFVGQMALFAGLIALPVVLLVALFPRRWFAFLVGIIGSTLLVTFVLVDSIVYHLFYYHLAGVVWDIIRSGAASEVIELSRVEWLYAGLIVAGIAALETGLAFWLWRRLWRRRPRLGGKMVTTALGACLFLSYTMYLSVGYASSNLSVSARSDNHLLVMTAQIVPYYNDALAKLLPIKNSFKRLASLNEGYFVQNKQINKKLQYPLQPLTFKALKKTPYNIVIIGIDTWRYDAMNKNVTPNIYNFAQQSWQYTDNLSGGNSTRPGIFSLFYSIPANYWTSMKDQKREPVLMKQLMKDHYQMGIFASASLDFPAFNKTVFRDVPNLQIDTPGDTSDQRDAKITQEFTQFIGKHNTKQPFFSFLFYDGVHDWCGSKQHYAKPFQPAIQTCDRLALNSKTNPTPYHNRYLNAAHHVDTLVAQDLAVLKKEHLLKNTVVIITADHGSEFNDEHQGYWGHASAYDPYQIHTPMIVHWPGKKPRVINHRTSHFDVVPTLMTKVLGCASPVMDYSVGHLLNDKIQRGLLIVGSYIDYAIVQPHRITTIYPGGDYAITDQNEQPIPNGKINSKTMSKAFTILNRYFQ